MTPRKPPEPRTPYNGKQWKVELVFRGNLLLSHERAVRAWISGVGGNIQRVDHDGDVVCTVTAVVNGLSSMAVISWVGRRLGEAVPGDRIVALQLGVIKAGE